MLEKPHRSFGSFAGLIFDCDGTLVDSNELHYRALDEASPIRARHEPARPKRHRLVHIERLLDLGLGLMAKAEGESTELRRFKTYRDGLLIATLAARQLRLGNLTGLTLGRTLVQQGDGWWIQIPAAETKTKDPIELP